MAAIQYIVSPEKDFSKGIDSRSAENQITTGFCKDLLNADIVENRARKRPGYQGYAGNVPVRVTELSYDDTTNEMILTLDSSVSLESAVDLSSIRSSPLVMYGRSSVFTTGQGPITTTDSLHYYEAFTVPLRKQFLAPSGTLVVEGAEHGILTTSMFASVVSSTSLSDHSYEAIIPGNISIDKTSYDVSIPYTTAQNQEVFVYFQDMTPVVGTTFVAALSHTGSPTSQTFTISAATHALANFNIVSSLQVDTVTSTDICLPDIFTVASNGDVSITISNDTGATRTYYLILTAAPISNLMTGNVPGNTTNTVVITAPTSPWIFPNIYWEQSPGGIRELVFPDSLVFDSTANTITMTFVNSSSLARNFIVLYTYGILRSNQLSIIDASITVNGSDKAPQLTIWGLDHNEIYGTTKSLRDGWVTHIDSYRSAGEQRVVSGLGGNLFAARSFSEAAQKYGYPELFANLNTRTASEVTLGPLLWDTGETPARTRGYITADSSGTHWGSVTSVEYDTGTGWTIFTIALPSKAILDASGNPTTLSAVISTTPNLEDYLTVQEMSYSRHEGIFRIKQVSDGTNQIQIYAEVPNNSPDYNDTGCAGEGGIFTDQVTWLSTSYYIPGDRLLSDILDDTDIFEVTGSAGAVTSITGIEERFQIAGNIIFTGQRTSNVVPMRIPHPNSISSVTNLVRGDMLSYTEVDRLIRVKYINANADVTIGITGNAITEFATVTLGSSDTSFLEIGSSVILAQAGIYSGTVEITSIPSTTTFEFASTETDVVTGAILVGNTAVIDEELEWQDPQRDDIAFIVPERWIPIEIPDDSFDLTPNTRVHSLSSNPYSNQPFLRSTMVSDNLYTTNGDDSVWKFDGDSYYRAGIIPWQPGCFLTQETTGATIVTSLRSVAFSAISAGEGRITVTAATQYSLPAGTQIRLTGSTQVYTVTNVNDDGTDFWILLDRALDADVSSSGTAKETSVYRYYYRLNAVDANNNVIASATTGFQDHVVELVENAAIQHKLIGLPAWDSYDYDRLEVQIYRTLQNTTAPFYRITTLPMSFNRGTGYIQFRDAFADTDLSALDEVNTALKGAELGTGWSDPVRAKYMTTIGNKLVLGNIQDYPQLDIQILGDADLDNSAFDGGTLLFHRNELDTSTTTDMVNRIRYQFVDGFTGVPDAVTPGTDSFTVSGIAETVTAGSWIYLTYDTVDITARDLTLSGWWMVASVSGSGPYTATINLPGLGSPASVPNRYVVANTTIDVPVLLGADGNLGMVNGDSFDTFDTMRRMSMAINASMRMTDSTVAVGFIPWLTARGGNDTPPAGRLLIRQPRSDLFTPNVVPVFSGYSMFINATKYASGTPVSASTRVFPSRILAAYDNYAEIFDNPTATQDRDSDSALDINSADGQEVTGIIPFFGSAAFGAAQQSAVLVVFKTNSIYVVDLNQKALGLNAIQRIETEGLGCTAPGSISVTKNGIMFANESGIYCLRQDQSIEYVGRYMERNWVERVSLDSLALAQGHHYATGRMYKLSVPISSTEQSNGYLENSEAYVYNHTAEDLGLTVMGAWTRYDNHPATGWANLGQDAYFASSTGRVFSIRRVGDNTDSRDDSSPINFVVDTRANDFGNSGIRKVLDSVVAHYRTPNTSTGTSLSFSIDLEQEYTPTTNFTLTQPGHDTDLSDLVARDILSVKSNLNRRRGLYMQIRVENAVIDEPVELAGLDYNIGGLTSKGITNAATTDNPSN